MKRDMSIGVVARAYAQGRIILFSSGEAAQRIGRCSVREARRTVLMWRRFDMLPVAIREGLL